MISWRIYRKQASHVFPIRKYWTFYHLDAALRRASGTICVSVSYANFLLVDFGALESLLRYTADDPFNGGRLSHLWEKCAKLFAKLPEAKDLIRTSGVLQISIDYFLEFLTVGDIRKVCNFLKYACTRNDKNRRVLGQSGIISVTSRELSMMTSHKRIVTLDLLATMCAQDDPTGSNHVSVWNRDNLMYYLVLLVFSF